MADEQKTQEEMARELREALINGYVPDTDDVLEAATKAAMAAGQDAPINTDNETHSAMLTPHTDDDDAAVADFIANFGAAGPSPYKGSDWTVQFPSDLIAEKYEGPLYGHINVDTESLYVLATDDSNPSLGERIGFAETGGILWGTQQGEFLYTLKIVYDDNDEKGVTAQLAISKDENNDGIIDDTERQVLPVRVKLYDRVTNLFSRNTGILESGEMLDKRAVLIGVGSVGGFVAMQLARSGVGKFVLCDTDTLEIHNICRHQCGFADVGRYKVDAVKDKILNINPDAEVITYTLPIERVPKDELLPLLGRNTIIIGGGDNRASANEGCKLACETDSSFIATSCWTRAFAGEIFYWQSGHDMACYECALGGLIDDERPDSHANYFGMEEEVNTLSFEPGIACDIDFVTLIACKLALDLLNRDNDNYTPRVLDYLKQYTWACNTNKTNIGGERAAIFTHPLQVTNNLSVTKKDDCPYCSGK